MPATSPVEVIVRLEALVGAAGVLSKPQQLLVYECDAYTLEKHLPTAVVLPRTTDEVAAVVSLCNELKIPFIPRGAGTSLSGSVLSVGPGIVIALTRMNQIEEVNPDDQTARVQAGCVNAWITRESEKHGLYYAPDPSSQTACTIGGNIATNSGGPHTLKYGVTTNHVLGFEMVLPSGEVRWFGATEEKPEPLDDIDLRGAIIGCEGMFGIVTRAIVRLMPVPEGYRTMLGIFETVQDASQTVSDIIKSGLLPGAMEMMDQLITRAIEDAYHFGFPTDAGAVLIVELDGQEVDLERQLRQVEDICNQNNARKIQIAKDADERVAIWKCRKRAFGAIGRLSPNYLTEDGVIPRSRLPEMMNFILETSEKHRLRIANVFHAGDGNLHPLVLFDERNPDEVQRALHAGHEILQKCIQMGGSVSGEHGIGVQKMDLMTEQFSESDLEAMNRLRRAFDPKQLCNPHKMFPGSKRCSDFAPKRQIPA